MQRSRNDADLAELKVSWQKLGIESHFWQAHHFSSTKYSGRPETLDGFVVWCERRNIKAENAQTLARGLHTARRVEAGQELDDALREAWIIHPIKTR